MITTAWVVDSINDPGIGVELFIGPCVKGRDRSDGQNNSMATRGNRVEEAGALIRAQVNKRNK